MTKPDYLAQRQALLAKIDAAKAEGDPALMASIMDQVDTLDNDFREAMKALASAQAKLGEPTPVNLENQSQPVAGGKVVNTMDNNKNTAPVYTASSPEFHDGFLKSLLGQTLTDTESNAMKAVAVAAPGAIPTETLNKIVGKMQEAPLLAAINMMAIPGNISIPVEGTVNDASWVEMATASTDSADTVDTVSLAAYKLIKTVEITADLQAMAIPAFEAWLVDRLGKKMRLAADKAVCVGTGSNQPTGMLHGSSITQSTQFTNKAMTYKDLLAIMAELPSQYLPGAVFAMPSKLFFSDIMGMTDATNRPIVVADVQSPAKYNILGYKLILDDNITADNLIFGDLYEGYTFNWAKAPGIARDESVGFRSGSTVFRGMGLADGKVVNKAALVKSSRAGA